MNKEKEEKTLLTTGNYKISTTWAEGQKPLYNVDTVFINIVDTTNKEEWLLWTLSRKDPKKIIISELKYRIQKSDNRFLWIHMNTYLKHNYLSILSKKFTEGSEIIDKFKGKWTSGMRVELGVPKVKGLKLGDEVKKSDWIITKIGIDFSFLGITYRESGDVIINKITEKYKESIINLLKEEIPELNANNFKIIQYSNYGYFLSPLSFTTQ